MPVPDICLPVSAATRTALLLVGAGGLLQDAADETLGEAGLDGRDWSILSILASDTPGSQQELAKLLRKAPAIIVAAVDDLERRGLVERTRDPADRRRSRVTLTKKGERALQRGDELANAAVARLFSGLDAAELEQLHELLARGLGESIAQRPAAA